MPAYGTYGYYDQLYGTQAIQTTMGNITYCRVPLGICAHGCIGGKYGPRNPALYKHTTSHGPRLSATIVWRYAHGVQQRFEYPTYSTSNSEAQAANRSKWADAVSAWRAMPTTSQALWPPAGYRRAISGYNAYISAYMKSPSPPPNPPT